MSILDMKFKGFAVNNYGEDSYTLKDAKTGASLTLKGKWLVGSLVRLYDEHHNPSYYIHDGLPQKHSGNRYIPVTNEVLPNSVQLITGVYYNMQPSDSECERIEVKLDDNFSLVAERNCDKEYNEIYIGINTNDNVWCQDLVLVGQEYTYDKEGRVKNIPDKYTVKVYADADNEDYTNEFIIDRHKIEEEEEE